MAVVGLHTFPRDLSLTAAIFYYLCGFAVPVFFMSSGYFLLNRGLIGYKYCKRKCMGIIRIVVCWNTVIIGLKIIKLILAHGRLDEKVLSLPMEYAKCFLQKGTLWHFWYLGALMFVYLLLPVLSGFAHRKKTFLICAGTIAVIFEIVSLCVGYPVQKYVIQIFRLWTWLFYFLLGGEMSSVKKWFSRYISGKSHAILLGGYTISILIYQIYIGTNVVTEGSGRLHAEYFYDSIFEMGWVVLLFTMLLRVNISGNVKRVICIIAPFTVGIYIVHPLVLRVVVKVVGNGSLFVALLSWLFTVLCSMAITWVITKINLSKFLLRV